MQEQTETENNLLFVIPSSYGVSWSRCYVHVYALLEQI